MLAPDRYLLNPFPSRTPPALEPLCCELNSGEPLSLGAKVFSQVGVRRNTSTRHEQGDDVLIGEATLPFSLLKRLPFHYMPIRITPPPPSNSKTVPIILAGSLSSNSTMRVDASKGGTDCGLLGVGLTMVFPDPAIPDLPPGPGDWGTASWSRLAKERGGVVETPQIRDEHTRGGVPCAPGILVKVYEAEKLVRRES